MAESSQRPVRLQWTMSAVAASPGPEPPQFHVSVEAEGFAFDVLEPPLPPALIDEIMALWALPEVFGHAPDDGEEGTRAQLGGVEVEHNRHVLYIARVVRRFSLCARRARHCTGTGCLRQHLPHWH
jgi:hypothetical protein